MKQDGLLIIDKPAGLTSHDVVAAVRRTLETRRVGHTGTLDPFATGVLVVCLGRATRLARFLSADEKEYLARVRLGFATDSGDLTGAPLSAPADARSIKEEDVRAVLADLRGRRAQIPPMHSAKKIGGVRLYERARRGEQIERAPVMVEIKELELCLPADRLDDRLDDRPGDRLGNGLDSPTAAPDPTGLTRDFTLRLLCSAGTYVRVLAEEVGQRLGFGAHLVELRRTRAGRYSLAQAVTLEDLGKLSASGALAQSILGMGEALVMPEVRLSGDEQQAVAHGRAVARRGEWRSGERGKLCTESGTLLAVAEYEAERGLWQPRVVVGGE